MNTLFQQHRIDAKEELNWVADMSLEDMVKDSWHWQSQNPEGYKV
jgi:UDP-glucose 4-epimerase